MQYSLTEPLKLLVLLTPYFGFKPVTPLQSHLITQSHFKAYIQSITRISQKQQFVVFGEFNKSVFTNTQIQSVEWISGLHADNEWCYLLKGGHCGAARERRWLGGRQICVCACVCVYNSCPKLIWAYPTSARQATSNTHTQNVLLYTTPPRHMQLQTHKPIQNQTPTHHLSSAGRSP